jgi:hypothetical protein
MDLDPDINEWTREDAAKIATFLTPPRRARFNEDPGRFTEEHCRERCRVWKAGVGIIVPGFVVPPSQRLIQEDVCKSTIQPM